jgi:hypothetical protein
MRFRLNPRIFVVSALALAASSATAGSHTGADVIPGVPFKEGDVINFDQIDKLRDYLPPEFWKERTYFFYEGMKLEIGPAFRDYAEPPIYQRATEKYASTVRIGDGGSLLGYVAGRPFPGKIDCEGDPRAGAKIAWNFMKRWNGDGPRASYFYSYWDRGQQLPLYYEGTWKRAQLAHRTEPRYEESGGDIFPNEKRQYAYGIEINAPFDYRELMIMTYRYKTSDGPPQSARNDDSWVYLPDLRRVRRISTAQRSDPISGTDFTLDDLFSFEGIPPQYEWTCVGERDVLTPFNTQVRAYPYRRDHSFGPHGLSFADDRWELRHAIVVRMDPRNPNHPYSSKELWLDAQTYEPLYNFAYDRRGELWKITWHNHRWSEDRNRTAAGTKDRYEGWESVPEPRDVQVVGDAVINVQSQTGNRIEYWDSHGTPFATSGGLRSYIDLGRLNKGK